jgi:hypothetical protein
LNFAEAKHLILLHAVGIDNGNGDIQFESQGFIGSLRPYSGLRHGNFHSLFQALLVVGDELYRNSDVDRELVHAIWSLTSTARIWGVDPGGMLKRNKLITDADAKLLEEWTQILERTGLSLLNGCPPYYQIETYAEYISNHDHCDDLAFAIPYFREWLDDPDFNDPTVVLAAIPKLGDNKTDLLQSLIAMKTRTFAEYCRDESSEQLSIAIESCSENAG